MSRLARWARDWAVTIRHTNPITREGRKFRRDMRDIDADPDAWVVADRPEGGA